MNLFFVSCKNKIYIFHLESESVVLIVELKDVVRKAFFVEYPLNLFNVAFLVNGEKTLFKLGVDQIGTEIGA